MVIAFFGVFFLHTVTAFSQQLREEIKGIVELNFEEKRSDITLTNTATQERAPTDYYGRFSIFVKEGDTLLLRGGIYEGFKLQVTKNNMESKYLVINLTGGLNLLDEVLIYPDFTGDLEKDIEKIPTHKEAAPQIGGLAAIHTFDYEFRPDRHTVPKNDAVNEINYKYWFNGGALITTLYKKIFPAKRKSAGTYRSRINLDYYLRSRFTEDFFVRELYIERDKINEFIYFLEDRKLLENETTLNRIDLIEVLVNGAEEFNRQSAGAY